VASQAVITANVDLFTTTAGYNQDLGIYVTPMPSDCGNANPVAWKEAGGYTTYAPASTFVQAVCSLSAGTSYTVSLWWKTNIPAPGVTIYAGARTAAPYSPSEISAVLSPSSENLVADGVSSGQYQYTTYGNSAWSLMDSTVTTTFIPAVSSQAIIGASADVFTATAGTNQDVGVCLAQGSTVPNPCPPADVIAWQENGGAATYKPIASYVQAEANVTAGQEYAAGLVWQTNQNTSSVIYAGAGSSAPYSPSSVVVQLFASADQQVATSTNSGSGQVARSVQYNPSDPIANGSGWTDLGPSITVTSPMNVVAYLEGNASLFTSATYAFPNNINPNIGICVAAGSGPCQPVGWKESGGGAVNSPDGSFVQYAVTLNANTTYTIKLQLATNQAVPSSDSPITLTAGAGPNTGTGPNMATYSPISLFARFIPPQGMPSIAKTACAYPGPSCSAPPSYLIPGQMATFHVKSWNPWPSSIPVGPITDTLPNGFAFASPALGSVPSR
jgi:hypothetical protein